MKGDVSLPYLRACSMTSSGRRRTLDVAVKFGFEQHAECPVRIFSGAALHRTRWTIAPPHVHRLWSYTEFEIGLKLCRNRAHNCVGRYGNQSYGFRKVGEGEKQSLVNEVFHKVANRYDIMNDMMSGGPAPAVERRDGGLAQSVEACWLDGSLDVAGGTGDIAFRIVEASGGNAHATVLDINGSMLAVGRDRAEKRGLPAIPALSRQTRRHCPSPMTHSTPIRSRSASATCPHIDMALSEAFRVLKPGGRFFCLEFSEVDMPLLDKVYESWSFRAIPQIGKIGDGRWRALCLSGGIDPQISQPGELRRHDQSAPASSG